VNTFPDCKLNVFLMKLQARQQLPPLSAIAVFPPEEQRPVLGRKKELQFTTLPEVNSLKIKPTIDISLEKK
jgi:hypothetical protein